MKSDSEVIEWAKNKHPDLFQKYGKNIDLFRLLYLSENADGHYITPIEEIEEGKFVTTVGAIVRIKKDRYMGCKVCKKKDCKTHGGEKVQYTITKFTLGDASQLLECVAFSDIDVKLGDECTVSGVLKKRRDAFSFVVEEAKKIR